MALSDDVIALVHDLSSAGLAVTLIGAPVRTTEESKSPEQPDCSSPTRDQEIEEASRDDSREVHREDGSRRPKYSSMSYEVCPTRDREVLQKKLSKKIDVRYLNEIKSFKDKIRSSYLLSCNQQQCPMIQERLNQHQQDHHHHNNNGKADNACGTRMYSRDQAINVSPTLSRMRLPKFTLPVDNIVEGRPVQTEITMRDFSPCRLFVPKNLNKMTSDVIKEIPLRKSETREILPTKNFYKEHLQNEILNWLQSVPMFYTLNFTTKDIKENIVNNLAEKINMLAVEVFENSYEIKAKIEIENCLSRLPMWLHGTKRDQIIFKDGLREKLWSKLQELNEKILGIKYDKGVELEKLDDRLNSNESYEKEVVEWSRRLQLSTEKSITRRQVVDLIMTRLSPLLKIPLHTTSYKLILKGEIIDILDDLPITLTSPKFKTVHLNRFAEELANRLLSIQIKRESSPKNTNNSTTVFHQYGGQVTGLPRPPTPRYNLRKLILEKVGECLNRITVFHRNDLKTEICSSFLDSNNCLRVVDETSIKNEICQFLRDTGKLSGEKTQCVAKMIIKHVTDGIRDMRHSVTTSFDSVMPQLSGTISVYRWGSSDKSPVTSTPKKPSKKDIPKLNPEETSYMQNVAALIRTWIDTLPKQYNEDQKYKETIINDLAGDIMDEVKVEQLAPDTLTDKDKYLNYLTYKWLYKFQFFDEATIRNEAKPFVADFLRKLKTVPVPQLTAPQHGTRQAMENIKHMQGEFGWEEDYVPKGVDVLEDQISVWMNEQPSEIYSNKDKGKRDKMVHDLALKLQDHLRNKSSESEMEKDINQWLKKVVKPKEKEHIGLLSQDLKEKVINIPQDQTLGARQEERKRYMAAKLAAKRQMNTETAPAPTQDVSNFGNIEGDPDKTIREFIAKFIEHHYDIDDPMAVGAFSQLLKTELRKLAPPTRKEVYDNFNQSATHVKFMPDSLTKELEYIKVISDWLKNIPIDASYNTPGNKGRIEFINDLAKNIQEIEDQRSQNPSAMEYNFLIASMILQSMHTYSLPILPEHKDNTPIMVDQLLQKLVDLRIPCCKYATDHTASSQEKSLSESLNMSDIKEQNLSEFIADYIRINGREIADDEMKLEAWTARLLKEVKKMILEGADPSTLTKAKVYEKFSEVSIPTDESVKRYSLEIGYVKEISDWLKNLPLLPIENQPGAEEERIKMISELAEKMCDTDAIKKSNPDDKTTDKNLEDYIANWISRLPLDHNKEIVVPIVTKQLMSRMEKVDKELSLEPSQTKEPQTSIESSKTVSVDSDDKKEKEQKKEKPLDKNDSKQSVGSRRGSRDKCALNFFRSKKTPAETIVEAIENWSHKLPIKADDKEAVKAMKDGIARKLYQKVGELNVDPAIFDDEVLYRDMLSDEIDTQLENVPQNPELQKNREKLKEGLLNTILDTREIIKERSAGENYKHKLETTIDSSIPNPVQSTQAFDPGFEIYKNHLANMFILDNFDHANEDVKAKYEKRIRQEIDKYFESAQNKNALPLTKDQIYNELYSALFKVPMPNETSVIDEVEQVKTRCEVDGWFEKLPLQHADDLNTLLEWDIFLTSLTKRIHEIEKNDCKVDKKLHKEISKWLEKLPLLPEHNGIDYYADKLVHILKSTGRDRKYVAPDSKSKGKSKQKESKGKKGSVDSSQVAGPSALQRYFSPAPNFQSKSTNAKPCLQVTPMTNRKPGDIIVEVVEEWCNQLPLISTEENNKTIRDNLSTRIIIHISELNMDPEIFSDDVVYDELLDEELENVMSNLPVCCDFKKSKAARKYQLKEMIKAIKPLIKAEKARHEYKEELNNTVASILREPKDTSAEKVALFNKLKEEIVENFVQYNYNKNDEIGKQVYKNKVHDAVVKYFIDVRDKGTDEEIDPLVRRNQLLCELDKIPVPSAALQEEVEEIRMKNEVERFFNEQSIPEGETENKMRKHLSKRLCDIEKSGHNPATDKKMKSDIKRCLAKLKKEVCRYAIDDFINKLKNNEAARKSPPLTTSQAAGLNQSDLPGSPRPIGIGESGSMTGLQPYPQGTGMQQNFQTPQHRNPYSYDPNQSPVEQWVSLLPVTPPLTQNTEFHTPYIKDYRPEVHIWKPNGSHARNKSLGQSTMTYEDFAGGRLVSSSVTSQGYAPAQGHRQYNAGFYPFADGPLESSTASQGHGRPSHHPSIKSISRPRDHPGDPGMRQASSGPVLNHPSYGQIATPRQVAQSPRLRPTPHHPRTPGDITPASLFHAPVFKPGQMYRPLPVPIVEPVPLRGSAVSMHGPRRSYTSPENALVPSPPRVLRRAAPPIAGERQPRGYETSDDDDVICKCPRCIRRSCRGLPMCLLAMEDYFDECLGFSPMWCGMHYPDCFYF